MNTVDAYYESIDDNGNNVIQVDEDYEDLIQGFTLEGKIKRLRRLRDMEAFKTAQLIKSESDVEVRQWLSSS